MAYEPSLDSDLAGNTTVGQTDVIIFQSLSMPSQRIFFSLTNISTSNQTIDLTFGNTAQAGYGVRLYVSGAYSEAIDPKFTPTNKDVHAIASAASGALATSIRINPAYWANAPFLSYNAPSVIDGVKLW